MNFLHFLYHQFDRLVTKSYFPEIKDKKAEQAKLGILRIVLGCIVSVRVYEILYFAPLLGVAAKSMVLGYIELGFCVLFTLGLFTPIITLLLFLTYISFIDRQMQTITLGSAILMQALLVLLFVNHGRYYSIDALILKQNHFLSKMLGKVYNILGEADEKQMRIAYFLGFISYAIVSLGALSYHVQDKNWLHGYTTQVLLTNTFLCKYPFFFRNLEQIAPEFFQLFSIVSLLGQSFFQFFMLPLMFTRWGKNFVWLWGWNFFLVSFLIIQLSYLPHIEIIIWIMLFHRFSAKDKFFPKLFAVNPNPIPINPQKSRVGKVAVAMYLCVILLYIPLNFPYLANLSETILGSSYGRIASVIYKFGFDMPIVFNHTDLAMGDRWTVIYRLNHQQKELVPLTGLLGERLNYQNFDVLNFKNHNSDLLYFRTTLQYRRGLIGKDIKQVHQDTNSEIYQKLYDMMYIDKKYTQSAGKVKYLYEIYENHASDAEYKDLSVKYKPILVYQDSLIID
ncbi:MAG: hypothetical protein ACKVTZ_08410 [Bacteroidia bacterium]